MTVCTLIPSIILLVWNVPIGAKFFAYYLGGVGYAGQASNFAWANASIRDDDTLRALTLASMNLCSNLWFVLTFSSLVILSDADRGSLTSFLHSYRNLWYSRIIFPTVAQPKFRTGMIATIITGVVTIFIAAGIVYFERRDVRAGKMEAFSKKADVGAEGAEESEVGEDKEDEKAADVDVGVHPVAPVISR